MNFEYSLKVTSIQQYSIFIGKFLIGISVSGIKLFSFPRGIVITCVAFEYV